MKGSVTWSLTVGPQLPFCSLCVNCYVYQIFYLPFSSSWFVIYESIYCSAEREMTSSTRICHLLLQFHCYYCFLSLPSRLLFIAVELFIALSGCLYYFICWSSLWCFMSALLDCNLTYQLHLVGYSEHQASSTYSSFLSLSTTSPAGFSVQMLGCLDTLRSYCSNYWREFWYYVQWDLKS